MSEALLYSLSQHLRLLARASVRTTADGRILCGEVDRQVEHQRQRLLAILELLQDNGVSSLTPEDQAYVDACSQVVDANRLQIRALRRQLETA